MATDATARATAGDLAAHDRTWALTERLRVEAATNATTKAAAEARASTAAQPIPVPDGTASLLTTLLAKFDDMTTQQTVMMQEQNTLLLRMSEQAEQGRRQQEEIERIRRTAAEPKPREQIHNKRVPANVSIPSEESKAPRYYAVAKGRKTGIFTRWREAKKSVKGFSGATHKRFRTLATAEHWLQLKGLPTNADEASDISTDDFGADTVYGTVASRSPSV
jgi:hypothetical protein